MLAVDGIRSLLTLILAVGLSCAGVERAVMAEDLDTVMSFAPHTTSLGGEQAWPEAFRPAHLRHADPDDPLRSVGIGQPLVGTSWRNRPFHVGWLFGGMLGDRLVSGAIDQEASLFGGYQAGWDFDHYWGTEIRFAFSKPGLTNLEEATAWPSATAKFWDMSLLYYPWGDAVWRPFASVGLGTAHYQFVDLNQQNVDDILLAIPMSVGLKYYYRPWLALRATATDNFVVGSQGLDTMHNLSFSAGVEVHFGGTRRSYFPYDAAGALW